MLCDVCHDTIQRAIRRWNGVRKSPGQKSYDPQQPHHRSLKSFYASLFTDCHICNLFCARLSPWARNLILTRLATRSALGYEGAKLGKGDYVPLCTEIELLPREWNEDESKRQPKNFWLDVRLDEDHMNFQFKVEDPKAEAIEARFILDGESMRLAGKGIINTKSLEVLSLARKWMSDCTNNHEKCCSISLETTWCPTRLLDLEPDALSPDSIRLIETGKTIPNGRYMTLSHCWGKVNHLTLTKATYNSLRDGISVFRLRQLFQDAIYTVRSLGCRYLWIDALCIFQDKDDLSDWRREAPCMQDVYANSLCNISALDAPDGFHSFFHTRDPKSIFPQIVRVPTDNECGNETERDSFILHDHDIWRREVSEAILHTRAWVVQERILAPRILHLGTQQILWECAEKNSSEMYPDGLPSCIPSESPKSLITTTVGEITAAYHSWCDIVETYTKCNLTFPGDKLIACAGLAKKIGRLLKDDYIAGLWRDSLEFHLLWTVATTDFSNLRDIGDITRPAEYRAPSWSWASLDGPISLQSDLKGDLLATVEQVSINYVTEDKYGAIRSAELHLKGVLKLIQIMEPYFPQSSSIGLTWRMHIWTGASNEEPDLHVRFKLDVMQSDFREENLNCSLFIMPIAKQSSMTTSGRTVIIRCLMLQVHDRVEGIYRRIGVASLNVNENNQAKLEDVLQQTDRETKIGFPCVEQRDGKYSIKII
ncbi:HET-domain-containing protein [Lojkania enalia]|uniref:HET-domain-containing protein n=1 Tax=Lojkania enalia TaxID=147567 RepID=A0A9P4K9D5_9PLEO|nr:HET-domain-containing protein [Didymosphaeria enalia]